MKERAVDVRTELDLIADGRNALPGIGFLEQVWCDVLEPNFPSYDVDSVQGIDFDEWCYTESCGYFMAFTQSVEINVRIALEASMWIGPMAVDHVDRVAAIADKWEAGLDTPSVAGRKVWFPPGANLDHIVDEDKVLRHFGTDPTWILKPHPVTHDGQIHYLHRLHGATRVLHPRASGILALRDATTVGYTTSSEMGIVAMMRGIPVIDFTLYRWEEWGRLIGLYRAIRESEEDPRDVIMRIFSCPWSGIVPLDAAHVTARDRLTAFRNKAIELRDHFKPLTRPLPLRPGIDTE